MDITPTTTLEAINVMLETISEAPVNTLENLGFTDASVALDTLQAASREVQSRGFYFNADENYQFALAQDGRVQLPDNVLSVLPSRSEARRIATRSGFLYDRDKLTDVFTQAPTVEVVWFLPFDELPEAARRYITVRAARVFQTQVQGDEKVDVFTKEYEAEASSILDREETHHQAYATFEQGMGGTTELEAVNVILMGSREKPVSVLPDSGLTPASVVRRLLRSASRDLQGLGWYFNTHENYTWELDGDGTAIAPDDLLVSLPARNEARRITMVAGKLIDRDTGSAKWPSGQPPVTNVVHFLPFEQLPQSARRYIIHAAGEAYEDTRETVQSDRNGNTVRHGRVFTPERSQAARATLDAEQARFVGHAFEATGEEPTLLDEAINSILMAFGIENTEVFGGGLTAAQVVRNLVRQASRSVQSRDWWFNTELVAAQADNTGAIQMATGYSRLENVHGQWLRVSPDGQVYDPTTGSRTFDKDTTVRFHVTRYVDFEALPETARKLVMITAGLLFQATPFAMAYTQHVRAGGDSKKGGAPILPFTEQERVSAFTALLLEEQKWEQPANMFADDNETQEIWSR